MLPNVSHLRIDLTPEQYRSLWPKTHPLGRAIILPDEYWQGLPRYLIARCPLCGGEYHESLDTYSLFAWVRGAMGDVVFRDDCTIPPVRCHHFVRVQHFINLNGVEPKELSLMKSFASEVPHVMLPLLPDDVSSWVVMHALPICRIESESFVPRYTVCMLTYYAAEADVVELMDRLRKSAPGWELLYPPPRQGGEAWWDLWHWARVGRLYWLAADNPGLPLQRGPVEAFPYGNMQGRREYFHFFDQSK